MSLSFVASAVQTATADGGFEETKIESQQADAINKRNAHKPLFEQLRQNQEEEQAKQEEMQLQIMRGTGALDDEDVAHLDALEKQRQERERIVQQRMQDELLQFRAARAERQQENQGELEEQKEDPIGSSSGTVVHAVSLAPQKPAENTKLSQNLLIVPKIVVKKRKRRLDSSAKEKASTEKPSGNNQGDAPTKDTQEKKKEPADNQAPSSTGIGGLLTGYGSSSDDSDQ